MLVALSSALEKVQALAATLHLPLLPILYCFSGALALCSVYALTSHRRARVSRFTRPELLRAYLQPRDTGELVDRADALRTLEFECRTTKTVFLFAPSGTGKSTMLSVGLVPYLNQQRSFVPILVPRLGSAWQDSEREALQLALSRTTETRSPTLNITGDVRRDSLPDWIRALQIAAQTKLLLIFDQMDDYVSAHFERFAIRTADADGERTHSGTSKWLNTDELREHNSFWAMIADLASEGQIHLLFSCVSDLAPAMDAYRFTLSRALNLERISRAGADIILRRLETDEQGPLVKYPENGWHDLKAQLLDDVSEHSRVLPMRLRIALERLVTLPQLTPSGYFARGGIDGLTSQYIEEQISVAAERSSLAFGDAMALVRALVDEATTKSASRSEKDLLCTLPTHVRRSDALAALKELSSSGGFVRSTLTNEGTLVYSLRHDYLVRPMLESLKRLGHESDRLASFAHSFQGAPLLGKWRYLLTWREQAKLWRARWMRKISFGEYRTYVILSLLSSIVSLVAPLLGYLTLADTGVRVPEGTLARSAIDHCGVSIWRRPASDDALRARAQELRQTFVGEIVAREPKHRSGWIGSLPGGATATDEVWNADPWTQAQTLAALISVPSYDSARFRYDVIDKIPPFIARGKEYGWDAFEMEGNDAHNAEVVVWAAIGSGLNAMRGGSLVEAQELSIGRVRRLWDVIQNFRSDTEKEIGEAYYFFPDQVAGRPGVHPTALVLQFILEAKNGGLIGDPGYVGHVRGIAHWLIAQRRIDLDDSTDLWRETGEDSPYCSGLTFQVESGLIGALMGRLLPQGDEGVRAALKPIPRQLEALTEWDWRHQECSGYLMGSVGPNRVVQPTRTLQFLWFPWALALSGRYLELARERTDRMGELQAKRTIAHLLDLAPEARAAAPKELTYRLAETVLGLSLLEEVLAKTN